MTSSADGPRAESPTAAEAMHLELEGDFEDVVPFVQLEHEFVGFETVQVSRLDELIGGLLDEEVPKTALIVTCHAEIAREALDIDPRITGLLPCTTVVYEREDDDVVHVHHLSATKAIRDLGVAPDADDAVVQALVDLTGEYMDEVWTHIEANATLASGTDADR